MMDTKEEVRLLRGRLDGSQKNRMRKLFDMMYRPSELAKEIGFNKRLVYEVYVPNGCPHERDDRRHIWINGKKFRAWIESTYKKLKLKSDQGYCRTCDKAVKLVDAELKTTKNGDTDYLLGDCPYCGRTIPRIVANRRGQV
ncbi:hypothetical protein GF380_02615 [Candidatus Uhrbacteria bacterium]|nr:hypothetical protein [Candidatus Uhrbacteria bacterium]